MSPDISVIIASRDRLWSLPKAVASCRSAQLSVEIIVVDDASADGTAEWLHQQPDVKTVYGEGWGQAWAINRAQAIAKGRYLRFLDSDDWLNPGANEEQFQIAERDGVDVVVAGMDICDNEALLQRIEWTSTDDFIAQQLGEANNSHYSAFLFRRDFVADIPHRTLFPAADFACRIDRCFILEVALRKPRIAIYPAPAFGHRHHDRPRLQFRTGLRSAGTHLSQLYIYRNILQLLEVRGELNMRRKRAAIRALWPLAHWIAYYDIDEACRLAQWIRDLDPEFQTKERGLLGILYRTCGFRFTEQVLAARRSLLGIFRKRGLT
jgi:glycosyltransferase involved in cell wall biosynthesis